jgi:hypothetical protein
MVCGLWFVVLRLGFVVLRFGVLGGKVLGDGG